MMLSELKKKKEKKKVDWKIFYGDESTFDSSQGDPDDAPPWDIQVIAEINNDIGRKLHSQADYYLFINGKWVGIDSIGLIDYLANVLGIVKVGRQIDRQKFREVLDRARNDPGLPKKSGWLQDEYRG